MALQDLIPDHISDLSYSTAPTLTFVLFLIDNRHALLPETLPWLPMWHRSIFPCVFLMTHALKSPVRCNLTREDFPDPTCTLTTIMLYCLALLFFFPITLLSDLFMHLWFSSHNGNASSVTALTLFNTLLYPYHWKKQ